MTCKPTILAANVIKRMAESVFCHNVAGHEKNGPGERRGGGGEKAEDGGGRGRGEKKAEDGGGRWGEEGREWRGGGGGRGRRRISEALATWKLTNTQDLTKKPGGRGGGWLALTEGEAERWERDEQLIKKKKMKKKRRLLCSADLFAEEKLNELARGAASIQTCKAELRQFEN